MVRIASFNVENLFMRAKALNAGSWEAGKPILKAYKEVNELFNLDVYTAATKAKITALLIELDIYYVNVHGAVRRRQVAKPKWAWFRKNLGSFDSEPKEPTESIEIIDKTGNNKIIISSKDNTITLESQSDITITSKTGKLKMSAVGIEMDSKAGVKIQANANIDVQTSAMMTLKGSLIKLN